MNKILDGQGCTGQIHRENFTPTAVQIQNQFAVATGTSSDTSDIAANPEGDWQCLRAVINYPTTTGCVDGKVGLVYLQLHERQANQTRELSARLGGYPGITAQPQDHCGSKVQIVYGKPYSPVVTVTKARKDILIGGTQGEIDNVL